MDIWTFRCYVSHRGIDCIREWYEAQDDAVRGELDAIVEVLCATPRAWWRMPRYRELKRALAGLSTLRIRVGGEHYRVLGFFGPVTDREFTLLLPFRKSDDPSYARNGPAALLRKMAVLARKERSHECRFP